MSDTFITYIAVDCNGNTAGTETADLMQASLDALANECKSSGFEFRRDDRGFMGVYDEQGPCFVRANSLKKDDTEAQMECLSGALRDCADSGKTGGTVLTLVRDATGTLIDIDPDQEMDNEDRASLLAFWSDQV